MPRKAQAHVVGPIQLHQRGRYWHASYTYEGKRSRESLQVTNLKVAQQKARQIADQIERGEYSIVHDRKQQKRRTFSEFVEEFRAKHKGWSDTTRRGTESMTKKMVAEWGHLPLKSITTRMIESYITCRIDQDGISNATANRSLACLKTMFKTAVRWGLVIHNPVERVKMLKEKPKVPCALTENEIDRLLQELPEYIQPIVIMAVDTGMRTEELFSLKWQDIDYDRRFITVRQSKGNDFRVIPMTDWVYETLLEQQKKGYIPYVLPGSEGQRLRSIKTPLWRKGEKAGIGRVHMHMFRHTFATRLRERGVPLDRIMELLGHKTMVMTLRYAKTTPTQLQEAIASLNRRIDRDKTDTQETGLG